MTALRWYLIEVLESCKNCFDMARVCPLNANSLFDQWQWWPNSDDEHCNLNYNISVKTVIFYYYDGSVFCEHWICLRSSVDLSLWNRFIG